MAHLLIFFTLLAASVTTVYGYQCFECLTGHCDDPFNSVKRTCYPDQLCVKTQTSSYAGSVITRACGPDVTPDTCETATVNRVTVMTCTCTSNLCNSAMPFAAVFRTVTVLVLSTFALSAV